MCSLQDDAFPRLLVGEFDVLVIKDGDVGGSGGLLRTDASIYANLFDNDKSCMRSMLDTEIRGT
jgi:hypothetical protein